MSPNESVALDAFWEQLLMLDGRAGEVIRKSMVSLAIQVTPGPLPDVPYNAQGIAITPTGLSVDLSRATLKDVEAAVKKRFPEEFAIRMFGIRLW